MKNFILNIWLFGIAFLMAACGGSGDAFLARDIQFSRVDGLVSAYWPVGTYVIKTESEWRIAWDNQAPILETPPRPAIDFASSMVVGLSRERLEIGCTGFAINRVVEEAALIRVEYQYVYPPPGVSCMESFGYDFDFVKIAVTTKPITFVRTGDLQPPVPLNK